MVWYLIKCRDNFPFTLLFLFIFWLYILAVVVSLVQFILRCLIECEIRYASLWDEIVQDDPRRKGN
jgi:hypothetical protein